MTRACRAYTETEDEAIRAAYRDGTPLKVVGARIGRLATHISKRAKKLGIPTRPHSDPARKTNNILSRHPQSLARPEERELVADLWARDVSSPRIVAAVLATFGKQVDVVTIRKIAASMRLTHGLKKRSSGAPPKANRPVRPAGPRLPAAVPSDEPAPVPSVPPQVNDLRRLGHKVERLNSTQWLLDAKDVLNLAQLRGRLEYEQSRRTRQRAA